MAALFRELKCSRTSVHVIEKCKECGVCAKKCPIIKKTELADVSPQDIQKQIKAYLETGKINQTIFARAFSCMECFKCVDKCCPEGLNPLRVNEIIKWEYRQNKIVEMAYGDPKDADSAHRLLASIQTSPEEYRKVTSSSDKDAAEDFFPNSFETVRDDRLAEAAQTGADILVDVCHHCHNVFCNKESENGFKVMNYASLVAEALGIEREDKFKKYKQWKDLNRILDDVEENIKISASPFSQEKIIEVLKETLNL